ncbi:MAG: hypothetical protein NTV30_08290 [Chloroflexi bacterium]|nr:hypothetical protein [Chloroflexota bacterium]
MSKRANKQTGRNKKEIIKKNNYKKWARILSLAGSIILFISLLIPIFINGGNDVTISALIFSSFLVLFAVIAIYMPLGSGIVLAILGFIWLVILNKSWEQFDYYETTERIITIFVTLLLSVIIAGGVMHIRDGWKAWRKK